MEHYEHRDRLDRARAQRHRKKGVYPANSIDDQEEPMKQAPDDKADTRAMPEAAQKHRNGEIAERLQAPMPFPAQRDVKIIAKPSRHGDMPTPPTAGWRRRQVSLHDDSLPF